MTKRILIIGAYGNFGSYITKKLAYEPDLHIVVAGRSEEKCRAFAEKFRDAPNPPAWRALDIGKDFPQALQAVAPDIVIHTSGPFQGQGYDVAEACIAQGCHYIDLADGRDFVCGIGTLDQKAREKNVAIISGASSVPCLTSAIIDHYLPGFEKITAVDYAISTAQRTPPGIATTAAILGYAGKPFKTLINGWMKDIYGWQSLHGHVYPEIGRRWLGNCDIPDLALFPQRYKDLQTIRFYAGLEVPAVHLGLWALSWLARAGLIRHLERWAGFLRGSGRIFDCLGSKNSAFYMQLSGTGHDNAPKVETFSIIARSGDGPFIPCIPSILLTKMLARGELQQRGALPCMGLLSLPQYLDGLHGMDIKVISYLAGRRLHLNPESLEMVRLQNGTPDCIEVSPRWPARQVVIDERALDCLSKAQTLMPSSIKLVVTRAYQPEGMTQKFSRMAGRALFLIFYPTRRSELSDIFGHNGHATDGTHVDVAIRYNGRRLDFLPLGVFTPPFLMKRKVHRHAFAISETKKALTAAGFRIHRNPTESLQIHCDLVV